MRGKKNEEMVADPLAIRYNRWPHIIGLLRVARKTYRKTALATISHRKDAMYVLKAPEIERSLGLFFTREDVNQALPDSEIYLLEAQKLDVPLKECLVLEV